MRLPALSRWREFPFHPFLFSVFPITSLYAANLGKGYLGAAIAIAAGLVIIVAVLWLLLNLLTRQASASAIILTAFLLLFFSLGHLISALGTMLEKLQVAEQTEFLVKGETSLIVWLSVGAVILLAITRRVLRRAGELDAVTRFLNIVALALLVISGLNLAYNGVSFYVIPRLQAEMEKPPTTTADQGSAGYSAGATQASATAANSEATEKNKGVKGFIRSWRQNVPAGGIAIPSSPPDIYYIVVDAYARQDVLQSLYGYDNSEFIDYLVDKGFYVADYSAANYPQTALSLASTLNMMYLDDVIDQVGTHTSNRTPLDVMIKQSEVFSLLRNSGYKLTAFDSGYDPTRIRDADEYLSPPGWSPSAFEEAFIMLTPMSVFRRTIADYRRARTLYMFDHIPDATEDDRATLVFAHITIPHFPFIFDAEGCPIEPSKGAGNREDYGDDEYLELYTDQLVFTSEKVISIIDEILSQSPEPPIIILQSDHGPAAQLAPSWSLSHSNVTERLSILNAYFFPDRDYTSLYEGISPVNTFRVVLNEYFGMDFELLVDRAFFSSWSRPYDLTEVTSELKRGE